MIIDGMRGTTQSGVAYAWCTLDTVYSAAE